MTIHLTPEQEPNNTPSFAGTQEELNALIADGLASRELTEAEFWSAVGAQTGGLLVDYKSGLHS